MIQTNRPAVFVCLPSSHAHDCVFQAHQLVCPAFCFAACLLVNSSLSLQWETPAEFLRQHHSGETSISGPQLYELSRLCHYTDFSRLRLVCGENMHRYTSMIIIVYNHVARVLIIEPALANLFPILILYLYLYILRYL